MRTVIVGGAGFIGISVAQALTSIGIDVLILDRNDRLRRAEDLLGKFICSPFNFPDVTGIEEHLQGADVLIHLACTTLPATSLKSFTYDASTNIVPSLAVFDAAIASGVKKIIFASSGGAAYGSIVSLPITENHMTKPISAYGVSKLSIERYLSIYGLQNEISAISLRIGNPYGKYQYRGSKVGVIARYLQAVKNNDPIAVWGDGSITRDYLFIDDLAEAFVTSINSSYIPSGEYNIGSGHGYSLNAVIDNIIRVTGKKVKVEYMPRREFDPPTIVLDSNKFSKFTGWVPKVSLIDGIERMWKSI